MSLPTVPEPSADASRVGRRPSSTSSPTSWSSSGATCTPTPSSRGPSAGPPSWSPTGGRRGRLRPSPGCRRPGLIAELGDDGPLVALRADLDALPVARHHRRPVGEHASPGVAHACGHDVHTTALVGAARRAGRGARRRACCPGRVRLLFQPAEEVMPGGALHLIDRGRPRRASTRIFALHCDPTLDVGQVGLRDGPITGAADRARGPARRAAAATPRARTSPRTSPSPSAR